MVHYAYKLHPTQLVSDRQIHPFTAVPYRACHMPSSSWVIIESVPS